jgi:hypothetical protein
MTTASNDASKALPPKDFLLNDYDLKVRYLTDHFDRMWTRFNYFVGIESALGWDRAGRFPADGEDRVLTRAIRFQIVSTEMDSSVRRYGGDERVYYAKHKPSARNGAK